MWRDALQKFPVDGRGILANKFSNVDIEKVFSAAQTYPFSKTLSIKTWIDLHDSILMDFILHEISYSNKKANF